MAASFTSRAPARNPAISSNKTHMRWRTSRRPAGLLACPLLHLVLSSISIMFFPSTRRTTSQAFLLSPLPGASTSWLHVRQRSRRPGRLCSVERFSGVHVVGNAGSDGSNGCNGGGGGNNRHRGNNGDGGGDCCGGGDGGGRGGEPDHPLLSITTFNVLAPIFKRVGSGRESDFREAYLQRHADILDHLKGIESDVICLQELWVAEQEMVEMYQRSLEGFNMYTLPRTESRGDGLACFVKEGIDVLDRQDLRMKGLGGRVALVLRLGIGAQRTDQRREVVIANTHLMFPHARTYVILRIRELKKLLAFMECYTQTNDLAHVPVMLCGDFNGVSGGRVYQHLVERGFRCSYEDTLEPEADRTRWITHVNHLGEEVGVDYVWYRNPGPELKPMEPEWESIAYHSTKRQLLDTYRGSNTEPPALMRGGGTDIRSLESAVAASSSAAAAAAAAAEAAAATAAAAGRVLTADSTAVLAAACSLPLPAAQGQGERAGGEGSAEAVGSGGVECEIDRLSAACKLLALSEGFELDAEELELLLESSADDFDFLIPTIMDGSSTGLEGASGGGDSFRAVSRPRPHRGFTLETISSGIWPSSLEQGLWPLDYVMSDHGSLTTSFRVAPVTVQAQEGEGDAPVAAAAAPTPAGDSIGQSGGFIMASDTEARGAGGVVGDRTETRDWGGGDDGHYGLR